MIKKYFNHQKLIAFLLIFLISGFGILGVARPARASAGDLLLEGMTALTTWGIKMLAGCLEMAVKLLTKILNWDDFMNAPIVKIGWTITRDLANMFFVLVLLMIAFGLILRQETYGSKVLLRNLIIAALLINFSLVIAGVVIDSSQVLTDFFISQSGGENLMQSNLMDATQAVKTLTVRDDVVKEVVKKDADSAAIDVFVGAILSVIFLLITFFVFAAYGLFLIVRIVYLWILLVFAPLVWLLWTLPATKKFWTMWWDSFLKWCFFAPAAAFFIYLAITSYKTLLTAKLAAGLQPSEAAVFLPKITEPASFVSYILIIALLFGGIRVAQLAGVWGANGAISLAKQGKDKTIGWAKRRGKEITTRPTGRVTGAIAEQLAKRGFFSRQLVARPLRATAEKTKAADKAAIERYEKKYKPYSEENLKSDFKAIVATPHAKAAIAKILAERNKVEADKGFTKKDVENVANIAKKYGLEEKIVNSRPDLAPSIGEDIAKIIANLSKVENGMKNLSSTSLKNSEVMKEIRKQIIEKAGNWDKDDLKALRKSNFDTYAKIRDDIIDNIGYKTERWEQLAKERPQIVKYFENSPDKALFEAKKKGGEKEEKKEEQKPPIGFKA